MEQSPSWEANLFSDSQEITRILWNSNVHYSIHKWPPPVSILSQIAPVLTLNIPLPEDPSSHYSPIYAWVFQVVSFPQASPLKPCIHLSPSHAPLISFFSIWSPEKIVWAEHYSPPYVVFSTPCYLVPFRPKYSLQHHILQHPQLRSLRQCEWPSFTPIQNKSWGTIVL